MAEISVLTPAFAAQRRLPSSIARILDQDFEDWEMLIVSDDGVDYQSILAREGIADPRLRFLQTAVRGSGPNVARNLALHAARGRFIAPLDPDDLCDPRRLGCLRALAADHGMAGDNLHVIDEAGSRPGHLVFPLDPPLHFLTIDDLYGIPVPLSFVFHRSLVAGGWDEDMGPGSDILFTLRAMERVERAVIYSEPMHEYRFRPGSIGHGFDTTEGAETAYRCCLQRLREGDLGFRNHRFREAVARLLWHKRRLNRAYRRAIHQGFSGSFLHFLGLWENHA